MGLRDWLAVAQFLIMLIGFALLVAKIKFQTDVNTEAIKQNKTDIKEELAAHRQETDCAIQKIENDTRQGIARVDSALALLSQDVKEIREATYRQVLLRLDKGIADLKLLLNGCIWNKYRPDEFVRQTEIKDYPTRKEVVHLIADKVHNASIGSEKQG